jgi:hypothetical protein
MRSREDDRDIGAQKANAPQYETGAARSVDRVKDDPVRGFDRGSPVQLSPKDLYEIGIL